MICQERLCTREAESQPFLLTAETFEFELHVCLAHRLRLEERQTETERTERMLVDAREQLAVVDWS